MPTDKPAAYQDLGMYYATRLNEGATKDEIIAEFISDYEEGYMTQNTLEAIGEVFVMNSNDMALALEIVEEIKAYFSTTTTTSASSGVGDIIGGVVDGAGDAIGGIVDGAGDALGGVVDGAGGFLDTILGVLGGLGDILFGGGGEGSEDPTEDENDDPWNDEESTTNSGDSQVPNQGDTAVVSIATVALVAGAALVLTRKNSEDAE